MSVMDNSWNNTDRIKPKYSVGNPSQCQCAQRNIQGQFTRRIFPLQQCESTSKIGSHCYSLQVSCKCNISTYFITVSMQGDQNFVGYKIHFNCINMHSIVQVRLRYVKWDAVRLGLWCQRTGKFYFLLNFVFLIMYQAFIMCSTI